mmetsp:Transcript_171189/g.548771  ORF Transcript_171189/g.548771 Transcript_171189/m.548771 type:complete len:249 (+) Transcript_171189:331-1077(+)
MRTVRPPSPFAIACWSHSTTQTPGTPRRTPSEPTTCRRSTCRAAPCRMRWSTWTWNQPLRRLSWGWASSSKISIRAKPTPGSATAASGDWRPASWTRWPRSPCHVGATASATRTAPFSRNWSMAGSRRSRIIGYRSRCHGRFPDQMSPTQCALAVELKITPTKQGGPGIAGLGARSFRRWPTTIRSQASTPSTPTTCGSGGHCRRKSSTSLPSASTSTPRPSSSADRPRTCRRCSTRLTTGWRARPCD